MEQLYYFLISYIIIIFGGLLFFNFLTNGFLLAIIRIKASRGRKLLAIIKSPLEFYPSKGWIEGGRFRWYDNETKRKEKNKISKSIDIRDDKPSPFFRLFGVTCALVDEEKNYLINPRLATAGGTIDAINQENLIMWALTRPSQNEKLAVLLFVIIAITVICLLATGFIAYKVNMLQTLIQGLRAVNPVAGVNIGG